MNNATPSTRVDVFASLPSEAQFRSFGLEGNFRLASDYNDRPAVESQQLDEERARQTLADHHANIKKLLKAEKPTGTPHLFILDPEGLAVGDGQAQVTMQALANAHFASSEKTAAVMIAPTNGFSPSAQVALDLVKSTVLEDTGVVALESLEDLQAWLAKF